MSYVPRLCGRWSASRRFHCHHRLRPCSDHSRSFCASRLPSDTSRGSKDGLRLSLGGLLSDRFALFFLSGDHAIKTENMQAAHAVYMLIYDVTFPRGAEYGPRSTSRASDFCLFTRAGKASR